MINPFADVKAGSQTNKARQFFITREMASKVLEALRERITMTPA